MLPAIFRAGRWISELYQDLGCLYHLVQKDHHSAPTIPSLSVVGFAHWMEIQILAYPETEWRRMEKIMSGMPVDADGDLVDGKPERLPKQLSRHLLPEREDPTSRQLLNTSVENHFYRVETGGAYPPRPPPIDSNRRSRDERQYRWDSGYNSFSPSEFNSPHDAENWDRYQTQGAEIRRRARGGSDKPYGLASITADPREARGASKEEWYSGDGGFPYQPRPESLTRQGEYNANRLDPSYVTQAPAAPTAAEVPPRDSLKPIIPVVIEESHENQTQPQEKQVDPARLSAFIKSGQANEGLELSSKPEEIASGPCLFVQAPTMYQEDITNLQRRIFELGESALRNIRDQGGFHELYPPYSIPSDSSDRIRTLILANLDIIAAINEGLKILAEVDFCDSTYNVIVSDPDRADVLRVVPIKKGTLQVLTNLIQEVECNYVSSFEDDLLEETLDDVKQATQLVISDLGLDVSFPNLFDRPLSEKVDIVSQMVFSTFSILFLALVSFATSHLYMEKVSENIMDRTSFAQLVIPTLDRRIVMTPRRLGCLNGFIKSPVWTFQTVPVSNPHSHLSVDGRRYYLSVFLADFADLWGPLRLQYVGDSTDVVSEVLVRGGIIQTAEDEAVTLRANETLCHWLDWTDVKSATRNSQRRPISTTHRLLIGTPGIERGLNEQRFLVSTTCACDGKKLYSDSRDAFELKTRIPSWSLAERTAQISGGAYVNLLYGHTWKFNAGWTLKDVIVVDWVEQSREPSHVPKPFYLDYLVVLNISRCTGHSRRVSLWSLFREEALRRYLRQALDDCLYRDFETIVQFFPPDTSFIHIWKSISKNGQEVFKAVSREVLTILRSTGVGEDGSLQVWDVTSSNRLDGRKVRPPWGTMVKDDSACATFAIMTDKCVSFTGSTPPPSPPNNASASFSPVLNTMICITTEETVLSLEPRVYTPPDSLKEENIRPDWALSTTTFNKWKVKLSENDSTPLALDRAQLMESSRDQAGPDPEALRGIENRRLARKYRQRLPSINGHAASSRQSSKDSSFSNGTSPKSESDKKPATQNFNRISPTRSVSNPARRFICDGSFDFKNGKGEYIGKLILEPPQVMDLRTITEGSALTMRWEERKSGLLNTIKAKEKAIDKRVVGWTERKMSGVLPCAVSRVAEMCTTEPFVVEHIRGGNLGAGQKVLQTYIS